LFLSASVPYVDKCGICGGNNSTCRQESGLYNSTEYGYNTVARFAIVNVTPK
jgi:hypothetical protein